MQRLALPPACAPGLVLAALAAAPPPPGYHGPIAGDVARDALRSISGRSLADHEGIFGGGEWLVGDLAVTPYPDDPSTKGPHVRLTQGERFVVLPMEADGDAADLYRRVTGTPHPHLNPRTSPDYRAALARAGRR
jgi:hypothetical protein